MADTSRPKTILIIDDETHIVKLLEMNLRNRGYESICAYTGEQGIELARSRRPDLVLLDVMLPGIDGIAVCRALKTDAVTRRIPVLMLSAKSEGRDKISGLEGGADDYITKPFDLRELFLRIAASLRQVELLTSANESPLGAGSLVLDVDRFQATASGHRIDLTPSEFRILQLLIKNRGSEVLRETINREILGRAPEDSGRTIDVHMRNIRKKLSESGVTGCLVETVHGTGYKISGVR